MGNEADGLSALVCSIRPLIGEVSTDGMCHCCCRTAQGFFLEAFLKEERVFLQIWSPWGGFPMAHCVDPGWWNAVKHIVLEGVESDPYQPRENAYLFPLRRSYLPEPILLDEEAARDEEDIGRVAAEWEGITTAVA